MRQIQPHIFRRLCLQLDSSLEQILQDAEDPFTPKESLQTSQKAEAQLYLSPAALVNIFLESWANLLQDILCELWLLHIDEQHDRGNERDFQGLLYSTVGRDQYKCYRLQGTSLTVLS